ncbi:MAG: isopentenyl-diphosphate Delta-isomerase [Betaproteobacteria bacterium]|nr:isopentenyl-diphosphate Delta-isomerase [Betaproteobacteria bacterium]
MTKPDEVILVDENDNQIGISEKIKAHLGGKLHRAFSIFIFNASGQMLLQKRAKGKYHSGGLWSNACCSHPNPGENTEAAAHRRLNEELGFDCPLVEVYQFVYQAKLDGGLSEHEYDHVLIGSYDAEPRVNPSEVDDWKWIDPASLREDMQRNPANYTYWLRVSLDDVLAKLRNGKAN